MPVWLWLVVLLGLTAIVLADLFIVDRGEPREFSVRQAVFWVVFYIGLAAIFGLTLSFVHGPFAGQFFAGYLTEYSLSVDNLFVFFLLMSAFGVPREFQHRVLLVGITIALVLRGLFIAAGAVALERFEWLFFLFGGFLVYGAIKVVKGDQDDRDAEYREGIGLRLLRRTLPTTRIYHGSRLIARENGRRVLTPLLVVMVTLGFTDLLFALDSIPAIFGLTKQGFIVFTANVFALMGLRQLYFLLGRLLERLVYLNYGLSAILGFIGVKLVFEAFHAMGQQWAPLVPTWASLTFIVSVMAVTTAASLIRVSVTARQPATAHTVTPLRPGHEAAHGEPDLSSRPDGVQRYVS